ncbi:hypothetical protein [Shewanella sp. NIFS-20-20]|uniref:hypothetical protein n=1 Tax=Shewanella sp. NIFS-20-20 TaxID=2853806 RepID=UPI001C47FDC2|nr:hypothetical protein [Shewanella sp. NIFS-20-20]MBV7314240.1 hypothetical protein [Shewanella sp. NIFS-20-20]
MKKIILIALASIIWTSQAQAKELASCNQDVRSLQCQSYLEGIVDGALMYKGISVGQRLESDGYEARALKYRSGSRFQEANRAYCIERIPDRSVLVAAVSEAVTSGEVTTQEALTDVVTNLLDCQRLR